MEVLDEKVYDLLMPDSVITIREDEHKSHMFNAVEIQISSLEEGTLFYISTICFRI